MTLTTPSSADAVLVSSVEWGLIGRRRLSAMSGGEAPSVRPWIEPSLSSPPTKSTDECGREDTGGEEGRERRKLKNEDSSYDSDFDPCESSTSPRPEDSHEDVSRTASETLAAEFEDYITQQPITNALLTRIPLTGLPPTFTNIKNTSVQSTVISSTTPTISLTEATPQPSSTSPKYPVRFQASSETSSKTPVTGTSSAPPAVPSSATRSEENGTVLSLSSVLASAEYPQQVEFGVKLGYSESLVQLALTKLGVNPDKNELLDELIRLGAGAPKSECDDDSPEEEIEVPLALRPIIIDGSNVAMSHGNKTKFSCKGIRICVDWFRARGHKEIAVFVPMWRKEPSRLDAIITEQEILQELEKEGVLYFTPSRSCGGKRIISYDDRYIIKEALNCDGVIVSNDNYRDLVNESPSFKRVIETSLLMYSWVNGRFEPPDDPLGRSGPSLNVFLRKSPSGTSATTARDSRPCPYGRKCTYGNKCKYVHPERGAAPVKSVTEMLQEKKEKHYQHKAKSRDSSPGEGIRAKSLSLPGTSGESSGKKPLARTQSTLLSVSIAQPIVTKEATILEYAGIVSTADTCATLHTSVSAQSSLDSLCGGIMKGETNLFNLCSPQRPQMALGTPWPPAETTSQSGQGLHLPLTIAKQLSDHETLADNLHPKLQRQLSINPVGDDRLSKLSKQMMGAHTSELSTLMNTVSMQQQQQQLQLHQQLLHSQQQVQQHRLLESEAANRNCMNARCISPNPAYSHGFGNRDMLQTYLHQPLTRHSSSQETKPVSSFSQHMLPSCFHSPVGRNLSAPDQIRGGSQTQQQQQQQPQSLMPHITRLNSTSDSRLNIHGGCSTDSQNFLSDCFDDSFSRLSYTHHPIGMSSSSPGPIGSRPMSPQQSLTSLLQNSSLTSSRGPQLLSHSGSVNLPPLSTGSCSSEDERLKIFYHLSQLFPEAQVRGALARNPDETDPTKICMSILGLSGCRPMSPPQQIGSSGMPMSGIGGGGGPLPLRGSSFPSPFSSSVAGLDAAREAIRIEAYKNLVKVFPEEQVQTVMLTYPEETDQTKLCRLIMAINNPQS